MKITFLASTAAAAIGIVLGTQLPNSTELIKGPVSVVSFRINGPFDKWAKGFDSKEAAKLHQTNGIKPLYRGFRLDDPNQVIVIHQSEPGVIERVLTNNKEMIESTGHLMRTTRITSWVSN